MLGYALLVVCLPALCLSAVSDDWKLKAISEQMEYDFNWVDQTGGNGKVDLIFVVDESGSIGPTNFLEIKKFIKKFTNYFSIAGGYSQAGVVSFNTQGEMRIPMARSRVTNKCQFIDDLNSMNYRGGGTDIFKGLQVAYQMAIQSGRIGKNKNQQRLLTILFSDGEGQTQDPTPIASQLRGLGWFMAVSIGQSFSSSYLSKMKAWSSSDNKNQKLAFLLQNFDKFSRVGFYFHQGQVTSSHDAAPGKCGTRCDPSAHCVCDSLGSGTHECACDAGNKLASKGGGKQGCDACKLGEYIEKDNTYGHCRQCQQKFPFTTTFAVGATNKGMCKCKIGYTNSDGSSKDGPPCKEVQCSEIKLLKTDLVTKKGLCDRKFSGVCQFECKIGAKLRQGDHDKLTCKKDNTWDYSVPRCDAIKCPLLGKPKNGNVPVCISKTGVIDDYGTVCQTSCLPGHSPQKGTNVMQVCQYSGTWSGTKLVCESNECSALGKFPSGYYTPNPCNTQSMPFTSKCEPKCDPGFVLNGPDATKLCQQDSTWSNAAIVPQCEDAESPRIKHCPAHLTVSNDPNFDYATVTWNEPTATDNSKGPLVVTMTIKNTAKPIDNALPADNAGSPRTEVLYLGDNTITYTFADAKGLTISCPFIVTVRDTQPPKILSCDGPVDTKIYTSAQDVIVTWPEPTFSDNSNDLVSVISNLRSGDQFYWGTYYVTYTAQDTAKNDANCTFSFTVRGYPCDELRVPNYGLRICDVTFFGTFCQVQCQQEKTFHRDFLLPANMSRMPDRYFCYGKRGWSPTAYVPDCSRKVLPNETHTLTLPKLYYYEGNCSDPQVQKTVKQNTLLNMKSIPEYPLLKARNNGNDFTESDLEIVCGRTDGSRRRKRTVGLDETLTPIRIKLAINGKKRASPVDVLTLSTNFGTILKAIKGIVALPPTECGPGYVSSKDPTGKTLCHECPVGSYWDVDTEECSQCGIGEYTDRPATVGSCTACPKYTSTVTTRTNSSDFCYNECTPGEFSRNGLSFPVTCAACPIGEYQEKYSATSCTSCPPTTITLFPGATELNDCSNQCPPGEYSLGGLQPCKQCPLHTYSDKYGSNSCAKCSGGFSTAAVGANDPSLCTDYTWCDSNPCRNSGVCQERGSSGYVCVCKAGWTGPNCEHNHDDCMPNQCQNGAECVDLTDRFYCECEEGFSGRLCEVREDMCLGHQCVNGATCVDRVDHYECQCPVGYEGIFCQTNTDDCNHSLCVNGATCVDLVNGFRCTCAPGYTAEACQENIDECLPVPHYCVNGRCVDGIQSYSCSCQPGWTGPRCDVNIDECASSPCRNGAICRDKTNSYVCECPNGYGGIHCENKLKTCFDVEFAGENPFDMIIHTHPRQPSSFSEISVSFLMKAQPPIMLKTDAETILSYGSNSNPDAFYLVNYGIIKLVVNGEEVLTDVEARDGAWHRVCITWRTVNGQWKAYKDGTMVGSGLDASGSPMGVSKNRPVFGSGSFYVGQKIGPYDDEFFTPNGYKGQLHGMSVTYRFDDCNTGNPDVAWTNIAADQNINGDVKKIHNQHGGVSGCP